MQPSVTGPDHRVLFFKRDEDLIDQVVPFVVDGLSRGDRVLVIMTAAHAHLLEERLSHVAPDRRQDLLITLDAVDLAEKVAPAGIFNPTVLAELFTPLTLDGVPSRIYGEMTSVLVEKGYVKAAVELELLGQQFTHEQGIPILCGYDLPHLGCHAHDDTVPIMRSLHDGCVGPLPPGATQELHVHP